jgi:hypothetical protein
MGFLDYAWNVSLQKEGENTSILIDQKKQFPVLTQNEKGFKIVLPIPSISEEETVYFLGHEFASPSRKEEVGRLFRACVVHLTAHTLMPTPRENPEPLTSQMNLAEVFSEVLVKDAYVNARISALHRDKIPDIAFANAFFFTKLKPVERIRNSATRIMVALMSKQNLGLVKGVLPKDEVTIVNQLTNKLRLLERKIKNSISGEDSSFDQLQKETAMTVAQTLESAGPILESPAFQYTEQAGPSTVFSNSSLSTRIEVEKAFKKSFQILDGGIPREGAIESYWKEGTNFEASQAFNSWTNRKNRERKIATVFEKYIEGTRFNSVDFPTEDYANYMKVRTFLQGGSRRLLDSLRVAKDALDEDPRKEMGQLDLTEVIQKLASNSPRTDVFMQNEYLSSSFAWAILFDSSASMKIRDEESRALMICVAEATKELLMDPGSWTLLAFSDRLQILKAPSEAYSRRVRARIGGLKFNGLTYMPDAIKVAGKFLAQRFDEQRFLVVLSDGWPYGYPSMEKELAESIEYLQKKDVIVIGVGIQSERMKQFFKVNSTVYNQQDLIKKFSKIYMQASRAALEK